MLGFQRAGIKRFREEAYGTDAGDPDARAWFAEQLAAKLPAAKVIDPVPLKQYQV